MRPFVELGYSPYEKQFDMVTREGGSGLVLRILWSIVLVVLRLRSLPNSWGERQITKGFPNFLMAGKTL